MELPIYFVGESPCKQVDSLLVSRILRPRQKVLNMDTNFLLDPINIMNKKRRRKICNSLETFVLAKSSLSFDLELLDRSCKTNKDTMDFLLY